MRIDGFQAILLIEDKAHHRFAYHFLCAKGMERRRITSHMAPPGHNSAEQWVREQFPRFVKKLRSCHTKILLVVMVDADTKSVAQRKDQLLVAVPNQNLESLGPDKHILFVIPKRNIETWVHFLQKNVIDEEADYHDNYKNVSYNEVIDILLKDSKTIIENAPPSLLDAYQQWQKVNNQL